MRSRALAEQAQFAFDQGAQPRLGMKSELDIAGEIAIIIDIARCAVRPARQFMQMLDARFGAAAPRAQQIPSHARMPSCCAVRNNSTVASGAAFQNRAMASGTNAAERQHRRMQQKIGEPRCQSVACRIAFKVCDQSVKAPAGGRLDGPFVLAPGM